MKYEEAMAGKVGLVYLVLHSVDIEARAELYHNKVQRVLVRVVFAVVAQWVVNLEAQLTSRGVESGAPHVTKKHLHRDLYHTHHV